MYFIDDKGVQKELSFLQILPWISEICQDPAVIDKLVQRTNQINDYLSEAEAKEFIQKTCISIINNEKLNQKQTEENLQTVSGNINHDIKKLKHLSKYPLNYVFSDYWVQIEDNAPICAERKLEKDVLDLVLKNQQSFSDFLKFRKSIIFENKEANAGERNIIKSIDPYDSSESCFDDPELLDYVSLFADVYHPDQIEIGDENEIRFVSSIEPVIFLERYNNGEIHNDDPLQYVEDTRINLALTHCGINPSGFWYLCLYLKDYVDGMSYDVKKLRPSPKEELDRLCKEIWDSGILLKESQNEDSFGDVEISIKVHGKKISGFSLSNPDAIKYLYQGIRSAESSSWINKQDLNLHLADSSSSVGQLHDKYRIFHFNRMLISFFDLMSIVLQGNRKVVDSLGNKQSMPGRDEIISKMMFYTGLTQNEKYLRSTKLLRGNLSDTDYWDVIKNRTTNKIYNV